jgi:hypothetical protein
MNIKDKINLLTNEFAVTGNELHEIVKDQPNHIDQDLFLTYNAVMISYLRISPKESVNFLNWIIMNFDLYQGFENTFYRLFYKWKSYANDVEAAKYLNSVFGAYQLSKGVALLNSIGLIDEYKYKLS